MTMDPANQRARDNNVDVDWDTNDRAAQAAEELSNKADDIKAGMQDRLEDMTEDTPKSPEEFINKKGFNAWVAAEKIKEKEQENKKKETRFRVDLDKYLKFTDNTCSDPSKDFQKYMERLRALHDDGCDIQRLDTAASGLSAESGEFMEIVKKLKFQGKPWNDANKEHLIKELGDILWYASQACHALDVTFDHVLYINSLKLAARYSEGSFSIEESENRAEGDI